MMGGRGDELVEALQNLVRRSLVAHDASSRAALEHARKVGLDHLRSGHSFDDAFQVARRAFYDALHPNALRAVRPMPTVLKERSRAWNEEAESTGSPATTV